MPLDRASASAYQHLPSWASGQGGKRPAKAERGGSEELVVLHLEVVPESDPPVTDGDDGGPAAVVSAGPGSTGPGSTAVVSVRPWFDRDSLEAWINQVSNT